MVKEQKRILAVVSVFIILPIILGIKGGHGFSLFGGFATGITISISFFGPLIFSHYLKSNP